jgi:2-iminobutanoate/2-iminopropanoate deaminase
MTHEVIKTLKAPEPVGPYNQAILASGSLVFCSGQLPVNPTTGEVLGINDISKQTEQVMQNLEAVLIASGAQWKNVVKTTVYLVNMNDFTVMNKVYARYFDDSNAPARACIQVSRLPKDAMIEIECIAVLDVK